MKRMLINSTFLLLMPLLTGCNEKQNPLLGQWQETSTVGVKGHIIEFTPSTMRMNNQAVTVVYQIRDKEVRVSASKKAIIYEFEGPDVILYEDTKHETVRLVRVLIQ